MLPKNIHRVVEVEEGFNPKIEHKVDILFLVDDSGSMSSAQQSLASNIGAFAEAMEKNKNLDYQIGVISTSFSRDAAYIKQSGRLQGDTKFVTRQTPQGLNILENNILALKTNGSGTEKFYDPLMAALDPEINLNPGFFRPEAFFVLIIITDTFDQSQEFSAFKTYDKLISLKAYDDQKVLGYGVISYADLFGDGCSQDGKAPMNLLDFMSFFINSENAEIGGGAKMSVNPKVNPEYYKLSNIFSLCDDKFGDKLANIGQDIRVRVSQEITLPVIPAIGSLRLKYGSQVVDQKWWKYDFGANSIIIDPLVELDPNQPPGTQFFVVMDEADPDNLIGKPNEESSQSSPSQNE